MLYFWMWDLSRDLRGKNYNLYLLVLLGHFKRARVQIAVDCLVFRQAKLPKETGRRYKDIFCKDWDNPSGLFAGSACTSPCFMANQKKKGWFNNLKGGFKPALGLRSLRYLKRIISIWALWACPMQEIGRILKVLNASIYISNIGLAAKHLQIRLSWVTVHG